ncbi:MAG: DNA polymerase III subunit delta [Prevotella sp.]|nr:DNA polymerase III subunit delta [Prevotella sp.]
MTFSEVIGQDEVKQRLVQMVSDDRLPHAIMLCGPTGVGKKALAVAFGCYLLAHKPKAAAAPPPEHAGLFGFDEAPAATEHTEHPVGPDMADVPEPPMLRNLQHPDLHFTFPTIKLPSMGTTHKPVSDDFAREWHDLLIQGPYFSIDQWLSAIGAENQQAIITAGESDDLLRKLSLKSSQGGRKVSIVWLPERMNIECANKLLKLIEEPPSQTVFLLVCEEPDKLLETIRSRVQRIDVKRLSAETICQALIERRGISDEAAQRLSRLAGGSWQRALEELQVGTENEQFLDLYIMLMRLAYRRNVHDLKAWSENLATFGREKQRRFLSYFLRMTRESFAYNFQQPDLCYMTQAEEDFARNFARFINEANVISIYELANRAMRDIGQNANAKIVFFDLALQMIVLLLQK